MKKFQQGGVFNVNVPTIPVGDISSLNLPQSPDLLNLTGREIATMARLTQAQRLSAAAQALNNEIAQQKYQDALEESTLKLSDKLFGPVHTAKQKQTIEELKREYDIPENFSASILDNPFQLKDTKRRLQLATTDPKFRKLVAEVAQGEQYRTTAESKLIGEDFVDWNSNAWQKYLAGEVPLDQVAPAAFKPKPKVNPEDYRVATKDILTSALGVDFNNEQSIQDFESNAIRSYLDVNPEEAVARGMLVKDPDGTYSLSDATRDELYSKVRLAQAASQAVSENKMDLYSQQRAIADAYTDGNRVGRQGSGSSKTKTPEDIEGLIRQVETINKIKLPRGNEDVEILVKALAEAGTEGERDAIMERLEEIAKNGSDPAVARRIANERSQKLTEQGVPVTPSNTPSVTPSTPKLDVTTMRFK